jgi:hypothetical protein
MDNLHRLFALDPEVAGDWGDATVVANQEQISQGTATVPDVTFLEYEFEVWLGDEVLSAYPCFIVTASLATDMKRAEISGAYFTDVLITEGEEFKYVCPGKTLPPFERLIPVGFVNVIGKNQVADWSGHDVCFAHWQDMLVDELGERLPRSFELVVTERGLDVMRRHQIQHCEITQLTLAE